ncbi:MAG: hypothetical protein RIF46_16330 [Cyclobacteriaceae bacterium]
MFWKSVLRVVVIVTAILLVGLLFKNLDDSPEDYITSSEAEKYRIMSYFESGKAVGRTALLEYIQKYENDSLKIDLRLLQALEDSIQEVEMEERYGSSLYQ